MNMRKAVLILGSPFALVALIVMAMGLGSGGESPAAGMGLSLSLRAGSVPSQYAALVQQAGSICPQLGITPALIAAQIQQESGWNPSARSSANALGISQFEQATWDALGVSGSPLNPSDAIPAQGKYMCQIATQVQALIKSGRLHGDVATLSLAAYNAGIAAVESAGGVPNNGQTPAYVTNILALESKYAATSVTVTNNTPSTMQLTTGSCPLDVAGTTSCNQAIAFMANQMNSGSRDWEGACLAIVTQAYGGVWLGIPRAVDAANDVQASGAMKTTSDYTTIPRGAVLWWASRPGQGSQAGHVAISIGGGYAISSDVPVVDGRVGIEPITYFETAWDKIFLGYSAPVR